MIKGITGRKLAAARFKVGRIFSALLLVAILVSVNYAAAYAAFLSSWTDSSGSFSCSGFHGDEKINTKGGTPFSTNTPSDWPDTCAHLKQWVAVHPGADEEMATLQYDTLKQYIEKCAVSDPSSWRAFAHITTSVQLMSADTNRYLPYRAWLISVLFLNTIQEEYFCACMGQIAGTFQWGKNAYLGQLSVLNYLRSNHRECWSSVDDEQYAKDSAYDINAGFDVSHLPPLDSIGLGFLLKSNTPSPTSIGGKYLASFTSSPNPFKNDTHLRFHLNRVAYTTIGIYDVLGHQVWGDGKGRSLEAGDHEVVVDGSLLPEGSLYARISTGFGEVRTVKLVKE
jgi:hypothetical protein